MTSAAIYCRISKDSEAKGLGVARQEADCRKLAERYGWEVTETYVDNDVAASRTRGRRRERPAYERLLADVRAGRIGAVLAWEQDRFGRDPLELEEFILLAEQVGLRHLVTVSGELDVVNGRGLLEARIKAAVAAEETRKLSQRLRRKHEELAERGRFSGGPAPYGYRSVGDGGLEVVDEEAAIIREAAQRILVGQTLYAVCADLNARAVPTRKGSGWRTPTLKSVLTSPCVAGRRVFRREDAGPASWQAVLDEVTWRRLRAALLNGSGTGKGRPPAHLLTGGLARCGECGGRLHVQRKSSGKRAYVCGVGPDKPEGSGCVSVDGDRLEEEVVGQVLAVMDTPELAREVVEGEREPESDDLAERIVVLEARLLEIADDYDEGRNTRAEYLHRRSRVEASLDAARREASKLSRVGALEPYVGEAGALEAAWPTLPLAERRAVLMAVLDRVDVSRRERPGGRFDPARVTLVWRA